MKILATRSQTFKKDTKASIKNLKKTILHLTTLVSRLDSQGKLPAQTEMNLRHKVCAITLRSGKSYDGPKILVDQEK